MVEGNSLSFVKGNESAGQKDLMLLLKGKGKAVNNAAKDFEELSDSIVLLTLVNVLEEDVGNALPNEGAERKELAIDAMEGCFEEITFTGVLAVKESKETGDEGAIEEPLRDVRVEVGGFHNSKKKFINNRKMGPRSFKNRLIFLGIESNTGGITAGGEGAEEVGGNHFDKGWVNRICEDIARWHNEVNKL